MNLTGSSPDNTALEEAWLPRILRLGVAGCFIGHGAFGILTKAAWVPYFGVVGLKAAYAWKLMPVVGSLDVILGLLALLWPCRGLFLWATIWATCTALFRPLSGESSFEFFERAGNFGVPLAFFIVVGWRGGWFKRLAGGWPALSEKTLQRLSWVLRLTTVSLLVGHAGCGLFLKKAMLVGHYRFLGLPDPVAFAQYVGAFEFVLAAAVLVFPLRWLLVAVCLWKISSESLFVFSGAPIWEFVERSGSYIAPLALALLLAKTRASASRSSAPSYPLTRHA